MKSLRSLKEQCNKGICSCFCEQCKILEIYLKES